MRSGNKKNDISGVDVARPENGGPYFWLESKTQEQLVMNKVSWVESSELVNEWPNWSIFF